MDTTAAGTTAEESALRADANILLDRLRVDQVLQALQQEEETLKDLKNTYIEEKERVQLEESLLRRQEDELKRAIAAIERGMQAPSLSLPMPFHLPFAPYLQLSTPPSLPTIPHTTAPSSSMSVPMSATQPDPTSISQLHTQGGEPMQMVSMDAEELKAMLAESEGCG